MGLSYGLRVFVTEINYAFTEKKKELTINIDKEKGERELLLTSPKK